MIRWLWGLVVAAARWAVSPAVYTPSEDCPDCEALGECCARCGHPWIAG